MPIRRGPRAATRPPAHPNQRRLQRVLATLCITQITSWGVLYYALPVLAGEITADTDWPAAGVLGAFSAGLLMAAVAGVPVGRRLDRTGPREVMTAGSVLAVVALAMVATAQTLAWFVAGWLVAGVAMAAVLYPPAFAAITRWHAADRVRALTLVTVAGGLASTAFAPLTAWLSGWCDWRGTYLVLAAVLATVTIPGHWFGLRLDWPPGPSVESSGAPVVDPRRVARSGAFLALVVSLSVASFVTFAVVVTLVSLLTERGVDTRTAAFALGMGGVGQVVGRLGYGALSRRTGVTTRILLVLMAIGTTSLLLGLLRTTSALIAVSVLAGVARGLFTLVQATVVTDRWGPAHYGRLTGLLSAPLTIAMALAPFAAAALAVLLDGYAVMFVALGALACLAAPLSLAIRQPPQKEVRR